MTEYALIKGVLVRLADGACIPDDPDNADFVRFTRESASRAGDPTFLADGYDPRADLSTLRAEALGAIDDLAERVRLRYLTPGTGQTQIYTDKMAQAKAWQAATANERRDLTKWPLLEAEVDANELAPAAAVTRILQAANAWQAAASKIERVRLRAKRLLDEATTHEQILQQLSDWQDQLRQIDKT